MKKTIIYNGRCLDYELTIKKVKNINLRIKSDGSISVSANKRVPQKVIDDFVLSKADFIIKALEKYEQRTKVKKVYFTEGEVKEVVSDLCEKVYPYFKQFGVKYPQIKFRKMASRWGSCHTLKSILTFNTNLRHVPVECIEYVVLHEFTHFLHANHSSAFYNELSKICPEWKKLRNSLKEINLR